MRKNDIMRTYRDVLSVKKGFNRNLSPKTHEKSTKINIKLQKNAWLQQPRKSPI
jgi:hypothetical protein